MGIWSDFKQYLLRILNDSLDDDHQFLPHSSHEKAVTIVWRNLWHSWKTLIISKFFTKVSPLLTPWLNKSSWRKRILPLVYRMTRTRITWLKEEWAESKDAQYAKPCCKITKNHLTFLLCHLGKLSNPSVLNIYL